jgi:thiol:disulfide interchange protein DsbD
LFSCIAAFAKENVPLIPADSAFSVSVKNQNNQFVLLKWKIATGYQLYKNKIIIRENADSTVKMGAVILPKGVFQEDPILGAHEVYTHSFTAKWPVLKLGNGELKINLSYQGCKEKTFCYPPIQKQLVIHLPVAEDMGKNTNQFKQILNQQHWGWVILTFFGIGILLAFTPCVLPMIPILSSIIVGQGEQVTTRQSFILTLIYVFSMACAYAIAGMFAGYAGDTLQAKMQNPFVLVGFSVLFIVLALSLFGFYELQLPSFIRNHLHKVNAKQKSGTYLGVALMGALSMLIVSPCISAPLVGTLSYIGQAGSPLLGGIALFMMGLGMGTPLLLVGVLEGKYLPKQGAWMLGVKNFFGILMLGMAIGLASRVIPEPFTLMLTGCLLIGVSVFCFYWPSEKKLYLNVLKHTTVLIFLIYGVSLVVGGLMGNHSFIQPLKRGDQLGAPEKAAFVEVKSLNQLKVALERAKKMRKPAVLDYYADWCILCKELDANVLNNPEVKERLSAFVLIRANVTANDANAKELQKKYGVFSPPSIRFFDQDGKFLRERNLDGMVNVLALMKVLGEI